MIGIKVTLITIVLKWKALSARESAVEFRYTVRTYKDSFHINFFLKYTGCMVVHQNHILFPSCM